MPAFEILSLLLGFLAQPQFKGSCLFCDSLFCPVRLLSHGDLLSSEEEIEKGCTGGEGRLEDLRGVEGGGNCGWDIVYEKGINLQFKIKRNRCH